ncbi:MAG: TIGR02996 domain-containing protein [Gemmataceae bacterium]
MTASSEERTLLAAVAAAPGDDVPRLVYADWLDEHGRPERAEFIRVQCELARLETAPRAVQERHADLYRREAALRAGHAAERAAGLTGLPDAPFAVVWDRGFVAELTLHLRQFRQIDEAIASLLPRPRVTVTHIAADLAAFLASRHLNCVTGMLVADQAIDTVEFNGGVLLEVAQYLPAAMVGLGRVDTLDLSQCRIADTTLDLIFPDGAFAALEDLDLSENWLTDAGVIALLNAGILRRLRRLNLAGNRLTDQSAFELADRLGPDNRLERLDLRDTEITLDGQAPLLARFGGRVVLL